MEREEVKHKKDMETIKRGSRGAAVRELQRLLHISEDGIFGQHTEESVRAFQRSRGLTVDGIVGAKTWAALGVTAQQAAIALPTGLSIENDYLSSSQYVAGKYKKDLIVLHHTAGWDDPHQVISSWNRDSRGRVATEFVIGGMRCTDGRATYDGKIVRAFPAGGMGYHIGASGASGMDARSVGIEVCNFGHVKEGKTYAGAVCQPKQIVTLSKAFRGYTQYHRYSDKQLASLRRLLLYLAERDNIDLHRGLYEWIKKEGAGAFDFHADAYYGRVRRGMVTHANIRKDKEDMSPQPELMDMILSL